VRPSRTNFFGDAFTRVAPAEKLVFDDTETAAKPEWVETPDAENLCGSLRT
jgi:hypothetical protein